MRTRNSYFPNNSSVTMEELLQAPTKGYGEAIVIPEINADHFEIKENFLQLVQANPYHGFEKENPHTHINNFKRITSTIKFRDVRNDVIKLMMFPYSLEGTARVWYDKEPPNSILTWEDLGNASKTDDRIDNLTDQISTLVDIFSKKVVTPATVKAVEESCVTYGGNHAYYNCDATNSNQSSVCTKTGNYNQVNPQNRACNHMAPPGFAPVQNSQNSNTIPNPKDKMKEITTRSGVAYEGHSIPSNPKKLVKQETEEITNKEQTNFQGSTAHIQPPVFPIPEPNVPKTLPKPNIQYPSRLSDQKLREKATNQMEKFFQIFQDLYFDITKIPLNENCSAMLLKKLPEKLGDPGKFLIPCDFSGMDISLPELTPTKDIFIKVGKFHFSTNFVVFDFEADPHVPLILGRSFLRTGHALIDVYGEEIALQVNDEAVTFNLNQTTSYSSIYDDMSVNRIDVINIVREEYAQEMLCFSKNSSSGNPTSTSEPIISDSSHSLTPFEGSDFILEEIEAYLKHESISPKIDHADCDPDGDIFLIEKLLNDDPF
nr:hypothetical protein [Tanacetum cinerariifolium]